MRTKQNGNDCRDCRALVRSMGYEVVFFTACYQRAIDFIGVR